MGGRAAFWEGGRHVGREGGVLGGREAFWEGGRFFGREGAILGGRVVFWEGWKVEGDNIYFFYMIIKFYRF